MRIVFLGTPDFARASLLALLDDIGALTPCCAKVRAFYGVTETGRSTEAVARWIADALMP